VKIIKISSKVEALKVATEEIPEGSSSICLTAGNFGTTLLDSWIDIDLDISSWEIFLTDERLTSSKEDQNGFVLAKKISKLIGFNSQNLNIFNQANTPYEMHSNITEKLNSNAISKFDLCFLSLGEDGHLAGHFSNSNILPDTRFCYTDEASKKPKKRISFNLDWLMLSTKVILVVLGKEKQEALMELMSDRAIHSNIWDSENLILITDIF